jgi:hypothetical protein
MNQSAARHSGGNRQRQAEADRGAPGAHHARLEALFGLMTRKIAVGKGWELKDGKLVPCYKHIGTWPSGTVFSESC